ncbi:1740_t:CDS:2, partial [Racocetra persica]
TTLINSFLISKNLALSNEHKKFRLEIVEHLLKDATNNSLKRTRQDTTIDLAKEKINDTKKLKVSKLIKRNLRVIIQAEFEETSPNVSYTQVNSIPKN